ncbi:hypothetical protein [Cellulomonas sp. PSBB021]|uniref:hypothetical protein n=1 Tax=Cellulomonas sp. PSBB021 TaxID=2003551 RepID=UPI000B8DAAFB|nr:hypothetical protein [Cellulomonas sp. PSBB021]ASR54090.1 hypothetical protein CBP52_01810 [Cellulomonas sp. PSBB021]
MRHRLAAAAAAACVLLLAGCASAPDASPKNAPGHSLTRDRQTPAPRPTSTPARTLVIEPLRGAGSRVSVKSLGFDVPAGWVVDRVDDPAGEVRHLRPAEAETPLASVMAWDIAGGGPQTVQAAIDRVPTDWGPDALVHEVGVAWEGMPSARAAIVTYEAGPPDEGLWQVLVLAVHDRRETAAALIQIAAPAGDLKTSTAFDVVRSVRWDP